jgi:predicted metal-dependent hydrolase
MNQNKQLLSNIPDFPAPILFTKSIRAKYLRITIKPDKTVKVTVPHRVSYEQAKEFLLTKISWAEKHLSRFNKLEKMHNAQIEITPVDQSESKLILITRLEKMAQKHGFKYNRVSIRNQRTRWGSCSHLNNINLNMNLIQLPQELQDYVIMHELVHTKIKNHSKKFWIELDKYVNNAKVMDKK